MPRSKSIRLCLRHIATPPKSLTLARGEVPVMVALRLFLPDSWVNDRWRLKRAGVPAEYRTARTKPEIALAEIDRLISIGVRFRCVLADAGYGLSAPFRQGLTARKLAWAVGIPRHLKVYPVGVQLIWPVTKVRGRPRKRHVPDSLSTAAEDMLASARWRTVSWRSGTKGRLKARFAAVRVRTADGLPPQICSGVEPQLFTPIAMVIGVSFRPCGHAGRNHSLIRPGAVRLVRGRAIDVLRINFGYSRLRTVYPFNVFLGMHRRLSCLLSLRDRQHGQRK